jgi:hypothetical protein
VWPITRPRADAVALEEAQHLDLLRARGERHDERQGVDQFGVEAAAGARRRTCGGRRFPAADERELAQMRLDRRSARRWIIAKSNRPPSMSRASAVARRVRLERQLDLRVRLEEPVELRERM